jgi:uncharacterized protein
VDDTPEEQPLRLVLDPNVLISAAIADGVCRRLVDLAAVGAVRIVACPRLMDELEQVLSRDRFLRWRTRAQLDSFVAGIVLIAEMVSDPTDCPGVTRDPEDDYLVALVLSARAHLLCSGDKDFDDVTEIPVSTPGDLIARLVGTPRTP